MAYRSLEQLARSLELLLSQSADFTYENVGPKQPGSATDTDWLIGLAPAFVTWKQRVETAVEDYFDHDSGPAGTLRRAQAGGILKYGKETFETTMAFYREALTAALDASRDDVHGDLRLDRFPQAD